MFQVDIVHIEFSEASDTLNHNTLLVELAGVSPRLLLFVRDLKMGYKILPKRRNDSRVKRDNQHERSNT